MLRAPVIEALESGTGLCPSWLRFALVFEWRRTLPESQGSRFAGRLLGGGS
jgi:hypothetical protein